MSEPFPDMAPGKRPDSYKRTAKAARNGFDWLFRQRTLFRADRTPYRIIHRHGIASVRFYPALGEQQIRIGEQTIDVAADEYRVPIVLIPPLAANTAFFDLLPERSLVRYLRARGFAVYLVDWGEPGRDNACMGMGDYVLDMLPKALAQVRRHAGQADLTLFGYCMGGLFALLHAGLEQRGAIRNIVTVASPVDLHDAAMTARLVPLLATPARLIEQYTALRIDHLDPRYLHVPGRINALLFKMSTPTGNVNAYRKLLAHLDDRDYVAAHSTTRRCLNAMLDSPGAFMRDFIVRIWIENDLADGRLDIDGVESDLARIDCPLLAIAGSNDVLAGQSGVRKQLDLVASRDKRYVTVPGGHAGVLIGSSAARQGWALAAQWLEPRSG